MGICSSFQTPWPWRDVEKLGKYIKPYECWKIKGRKECDTFVRWILGLIWNFRLKKMREGMKARLKTIF